MTTDSSINSILGRLLGSRAGKADTAKYKRLYEGSPAMHRSINLGGSILDCNQAYVDGLRYSSKSEVIGHSIFEHTAPTSLEAMQKSLEEWSTTGSLRNKEIVLKRKDGTLFPVLINASNLYDDDGNLAGSNTLLTDISEIYRAKELLERANQMKDQFINIAAHELRTPIQPILGCVELVKDGSLKNEDAWDTVSKEARRLMRLANNMLDVTRIESGFFDYNIRKVPINEVIAEVIESTRISNQGKNSSTRRVKITSKLNHDVMLLIDEDRMVQALSNIMNNAIKFTTEGQITVDTNVLSDRKIFELRISDTGPGIPAELLPKLFSKFSPKTSGTEANKAGTGLGLFIAKSIIQAHGGHVYAGNNEERGVTFVVTLPINDITVNQGSPSGSSTNFRSAVAT